MYYCQKLNDSVSVLMHTNWSITERFKTFNSVIITCNITTKICPSEILNYKVLLLVLSVLLILYFHRWTTIALSDQLSKEMITLGISNHLKSLQLQCFYSTEHSNKYPVSNNIVFSCMDHLQWRTTINI